MRRHVVKELARSLYSKYNKDRLTRWYFILGTIASILATGTVAAKAFQLLSQVPYLARSHHIR
jgi:hypothetical protein